MEKKLYFDPEMEVLEIDIESAILAASEGGINDDNSVIPDDTPSDDPNGDFGWN